MPGHTVCSSWHVRVVASLTLEYSSSLLAAPLGRVWLHGCDALTLAPLQVALKFWV